MDSLESTQYLARKLQMTDSEARELDAITELAKLARVKISSAELRSCWDSELARELAEIKRCHKGTRGKRQLAVDITFTRMKNWLREGHPLSESLAVHWLYNEPMGKAELVLAVAEWVAKTRPAQVWCSLRWLAEKIQPPKKGQ